MKACAHTREKAPNWSKHEAAQLCHLICTSLHSTVLGRIYVKPSSRAELDKGRHDPWSNESCDLFNNEVFLPSASEPHDDITKDLLTTFHPSLHPYQRKGITLKSLWSKLRSKYTIAREKYTKIGQGDTEVSLDFCDGDPSLGYMHSVFFHSPSLDYVIRMILDDSRVEQGIEDVDAARDSPIRRDRTKTPSSTAALTAGFEVLAKSLLAPVQISSNASIGNGGNKFVSFDISDRMTRTVENLMSHV